jgi:3-oxoacid CoA-transferase subunit B
VDRVITDLGVLGVTGEGFVPVETAPGVTPADVREKTAAPMKELT